MTPDDMISALEAGGQHRVLRRLRARKVVNTRGDGEEVKLGLALDLETTGFDPLHDEIIELAILPFTFSADGMIFEIENGYASLRQPTIPIPREITALTGLDDKTVAGHTIDLAKVSALVDAASLIIAHHAGFDRPFAERLLPVFASKCWACSMSDINWHEEGIESAKLAWILNQYGIFYDSHRATVDCHALIEIMVHILPKSSEAGLSKILKAARSPTWRVWAMNSPFDTKDILKKRGYKWSPGENHWPKSWYIDGDDDIKETEISFLKSDIYRRDINLRVDKFTAFDRFSERVTP